MPYAVTVERPGPPAGARLSLGDVLGAVPGVQVDPRYSFSEGDRIAVRGFGARSQFGVRGVKVLVDGIPATLPDGQTSLSHVDPWRVHRAEVLRGPASSLWGNAAGGVIRLRTAPARSGVEATAVGGSYGLRRLGADVGWGRDGRGGRVAEDGRVVPDGTIRSRIFLGASATGFWWDGHRAHADADKRYGTLRGVWRDGRDRVTIVVHGVDYTARSAGSLSAEQLREDRTQAHPFNVVQQTGESASQLQAGATWERAIGETDGAVRVSGWALGRRLENPIPPAVIDLDREAAGLRLAVDGTLGPARWTLGLDAEAQWDDRVNAENEAGRRGAVLLDQSEHVRLLAPLLEVRTPVAGPVHAIVGIRWDRYTFEAEDRFLADGDDSGRRAMGQLSPSLGVTAELGAANVYGNLATSFETPTTTELVNRPSGAAGFNPDLDPQRAVTVELGARLRFGPGGAVHFAAYRARIRDALIPFEVAASPGRSFFRNAGSAVHRGLEIDAWLAPAAAPGLELRATWSWIDARFDAFATAAGDMGGHRVPGVASHRGSATASWEGGVGRIELTQQWVGRTPVDDANTADAPAYSLTSIRGASRVLELGETAVEVFAEARNLFDHDHVSSVVVNAFGGRYFEPGPGRGLAFGARVTRSQPLDP